MKKITAAICLSFCAVLLAGCGGGETEEERRTEENQTSAAAEEPSVHAETTTAAAELNAHAEIEEETEMAMLNLDGIYAYFEAQEDYMPPEGFDKKRDGAEYGERVDVQYFSETTGTTRKCYVILPPGYDESKTYPVLYLLHGIGGTHSEWMGGAPNEIINNLIADGEAVPMVMVLPNVRASSSDRVPADMFSSDHILAFNNFINDLRNNLMPYINENFSVSKKREDTAIAGLSMGGREALNIAARMPGTFGYIGAFTPAPGLMAPLHGVHAQLTEEDIAAIPDRFKTNMFILINTGNQDSVVGVNPLNYHNAFVDNGVKSVFYAIDGGHDFVVWKNGLYHFAGNIFQHRVGSD